MFQQAKESNIGQKSQPCTISSNKISSTMTGEKPPLTLLSRWGIQKDKP
ncbi:MAG: hypothetical protein WA395_11935 [Nitrososphaeraceae archaeon]